MMVFTRGLQTLHFSYRNPDDRLPFIFLSSFVHRFFNGLEGDNDGESTLGSLVGNGVRADNEEAKFQLPEIEAGPSS